MSSCLLGEKVRYDGGSLALTGQIIDHWLSEGRVVSVCPEVEAGMSIPRLPAEIYKGNGDDVLNGKANVIEQGGIVVTRAFLDGASIALDLCSKFKIEIAVLAEFSPSCGSSFIYDGGFSGRKVSGIGVAAALLRRCGVQVFSQHELADANKAMQATGG